MGLVKGLAVENFRSLRSLELSDLGEYVPLVGLNSSGKSNIFRALNLFFDGYIDEAGTELDLARDFSSHASKGKKKSIRIAVTFDLRPRYGARESLRAFLASKGVVDELVVQREWSYVSGVLQQTTQLGPSQVSLAPPAANEDGLVGAVLRSFGFRYIPNHSRPSDLISAVSDPLAQVLLSRWKKTKAYREGKVEETLGELQTVADELVEGLSVNVARPGTRVARVSADAPSGLEALPVQVALSVTTDAGTLQDPELQGSGTQSFMLLHVLDLLAKTQRELGFGWWPYSIWAIEEPESFLHAGLRTRYAEDLRTYASNPNRQVFVTTHQDEFVRVSDQGYVVVATSNGTTIQVTSAQDALVEMSRQRVSTYPHPLFVFPDHPIVIVEGVTDLAYLRTGIVEAGIRPSWKILSLQEMGLRKGGDDLRSWLKQNEAVLAARPPGSPVFTLRDWEERSKASWDSVLDKHPHSGCLVCDAALANPQLDGSFVGIERFLETSFVASHAGSRLKRPAKGVGPFSILRADLASLKPLLASEFKRGATPAGPYLRQLAIWIDKQIAAAIPASLAV
jgi:hypothetical protein